MKELAKNIIGEIIIFIIEIILFFHDEEVKDMIKEFILVLFGIILFMMTMMLIFFSIGGQV